jgi:purine-binding chemotaxis protein CheW
LETDIQEIKLVCFRLGADIYALDIMRVREIIKPLRLFGLPEAPSFVEGVINLRGSIIPVVDLRKRFGLQERTDGGECRLLITVVARQPLGLIVDAVTEVVSIPVRELRPPPAVVKVAGYRYLIGVCLLRNSMALLVNLDTILDDRESDELNGFRTPSEL